VVARDALHLRLPQANLLRSQRSFETHPSFSFPA
jgi:hypothetical protein